MVCLVLFLVGLQDGPTLHTSVAEPHDARALTLPVRSGDGFVAGLIDEGVRRSATFAEIVERIGRQRALVLVHRVPELKGRLTGALLDAVIRTPDGLRLLHVMVVHRPRASMIATIAHELQHALEVLEANADTLEAVYASTSRPSAVRHPRTDLTIIETVAAIETGAAVYRELTRRGNPRP